MTPTPTAAARVSGTIKALEWEERTDIDGLHNAESPIGWWFNIHELSGGRAQYEPPPIAGTSSMRSDHPCIEAAKAAAQADYEARILAAIQPDPEPGANENYADPVSSAGAEPQPVACELIDREAVLAVFRSYLMGAGPFGSDQVFDALNCITAIPATPSSAGTVNVEAAALENLLKRGRNITASMSIARAAIGNDADRGHLEAVALKYVRWQDLAFLDSALRALAGEGGR